MVLVVGPRQVGKTTLAISLLGHGQDESSPGHLSWDVLADREDIPRFHQVHLGTRDFGNATADVRVMPFATFCGELRLP